MTSYHFATIGRMPRPDTTFAHAEHQLDRFITDHFWFTYAIVCGFAFLILGVISTLSVA
ncbi:MAG: hypothetical protein RIM72_17025 [Alphaproteobacteria bacterium]